MLRDLKQGHAYTPDIAGDGVCLSGDAFGSHVVGGPNEGICVAFGAELA